MRCLNWDIQAGSNIQVVTINSGSFQGIRKGKQGKGDPPGMGSAKGNWPSPRAISS